MLPTTNGRHIKIISHYFSLRDRKRFPDRWFLRTGWEIKRKSTAGENFEILVSFVIIFEHFTYGFGQIVEINEIL